ncbi:Solute carrier family 2 facilitated glucose transporter member 3 [Fasciola gigantica]|uniref:Solute carrier family 2 facilitated glucose transporter member 3 n=1 Tax=Fasciola gigantica TaxID=46835 RepID=A0A504YXM3_FASGI|nr:Solute carrier family 2 facilitated glucose transporter member 3 [Fasciola gigantica]
MALAGQKLTFTLLLTVFMTCFGSSFLIGYNLGILNLPAPFIKAFLSKTILKKDIVEAEKEKKFVNPSFLYAQVSTTFVVAGALGAFSCGWIAELLGRRNGLILNHVFAILGGILCGPCVIAEQAWLLFVGRFVLGINCGITIGIASIYLTEVAPRELRGAIGACNQLAVTIGIVVAYIATLSYTLNTKTLWPVSVALGAVPAFISLLVLPFCPESPRFLFVKKNNEAEARKAFARLNVQENVETFLGELREEMEVAKNQPAFKFTQLFTQRDLRMPVLIACLIQVLQQLSGINAVITYSSTMLRTAGIPDEYNQFCVTAIGVLNVIVTIVSLPLLERAGRRTLLLWPTVALAISLLLLTITVNLATTLSDAKAAQALGIVSALLILVYICGFALGLGPVPALIVSEIFRQGPRAAAYSLSQSLQWLSNLLVLCSYPSINEAIGGYSFLPFLVVVVVCWIFFFLFMPETRQRTFDEVARDLAFGNIVVGKRTATLEDRNMTVFTKQGERNVSNVDPATVQPLLQPSATRIDPTSYS